jgi:7,8-dihydropterin-6-yl-methyl-4-(beta-D-ribofuranosyl)aminobenzene 5'-phosphate synthase
MKLTIVYDNEIYKKDTGLKSDWGFSCLIETKGETILFDTGAKGNILLNNMKKLDIDPGAIDKIVISHEHRDHSGGLKALSPLVGNIQLYRLLKKRPSENMRLKSVEKSREITNGIYTTGRIRGIIDEQSLVLKSEKGLYILAGCSHPGVDKIIHATEQYGNIAGLIGGFHGFNKFSIVEDLDYICPCHCTAHKKDLKKAFPYATFDCGVGKIIDLDVKI